MLDMKQGLADCRKAYENKTLQFFMEKHNFDGWSDDEENITAADDNCKYFIEATDGVCYMCAVGAMMVPYKDKIISENLNEMTSADNLFTSLKLINLDNWNEDYAKVMDLKRLQQAHDRVVVALLDPGGDFEHYKREFLEYLTELETRYG